MKLPIQSQPVLRNVSTAKIDDGMPGITASIRWACYWRGLHYKGDVEVWWSNEKEAGEWACNEWYKSNWTWRGCDGECQAFGPLT